MKVGIIGTGYISTFHAAAYNKLGVVITAVCDVKKDNYLSKKELYGQAVFYENYEDLLQDDSIDAVSICVTNRFHYDVVKKAVAAEKHIFCEKTMTDSEAKSAELLSLLKNYRKNFQIGYMKRFFPATQKVLQLLPELGEVFSAYSRSYQGFEWEHDIYNNEGWKPKEGKGSAIRQLYAGGMLNMAGSHLIDLMNLFLGIPKSVYALNWSPKDYDVEMSGHGLFGLNNGGTAHLDVCSSPYSRDGLRQDGWDEKIEINGTKGRIEIFYVIWDKPMNNAPLVRYYSEKDKIYTEFTFKKIDPFHEQIVAFIDNCDKGIKSVPGAEEGYAVDKILSACYESAQKKEVVRL